MVKTRLRTIAPFVLAAVLLYVSLRQLDWRQTGNILESARPLGMALAFGLLSLSCYCRALRWRVLLNASGSIPRPLVFRATMLGYVGNNFLPARAGEAMRCMYISRQAGKDAAFAFATAVVERVLDGFLILLLGVAALSFLPGISGSVLVAERLAGAVIIFATIGMLFLPNLERFLVAWLARFPFRSTLVSGIVAAARQFFGGLRSIRNFRTGALFGAWSIGAWGLDIMSVITTAEALSLHFSLPAILVLISVLGLSSAAPSTPGYTGIYQFAAVAVLVPLGYSRASSIAFIFALQGVTFAVSLLWGVPPLLSRSAWVRTAAASVPGVGGA